MESNPQTRGRKVLKPILSSWTTEEDKRRKIFNLPKIQKMMQEWMKLPSYWNRHNQTVIDFVNEKYEERESMCPPYMFMMSGSGRKQDFYFKYNERCKVSELLEDEYAVDISSVPTERTQTPEEALELSIWSPHNTFDMSVLRFCLIQEKKGFILAHFSSEAELDEAFCRDIESFSPAFTPRVTPQGIQG